MIMSTVRLAFTTCRRGTVQNSVQRTPFAKQMVMDAVGRAIVMTVDSRFLATIGAGDL
jgi:hypothetical protein